MRIHMPRTRAAWIVFGLIVANEIRGLIVVAFVLNGWRLSH